VIPRINAQYRLSRNSINRNSRIS